MSDPEQKRRMVSDGLIHYIAEVKAEILAHDPTALVTMGFFAPELAAPAWYVDTAPLLARADLDFFDFHAYPGSHSLEELAAAFGMENFSAKPIILGEYGAFRHIYPEIGPAARAVTEWQAESCEHGFDGWLYWTYNPAHASAGDRTWGLTDEDGFLMDVLSPANHPDPCAVVAAESDNLAYQKPVRASASLPGEPPANAVDENFESSWGAGGHPPQWIEIDLGASHRISEIRLLAAQYPPGETVHRIRGRSLQGNWIELHTFRQETQAGDWLVFHPETPLEDIQFVRVETLSSPSWSRMNRSQLLKKLDGAWQTFQESYAGLSDAELLEPGVTGAWSVRDIVAHVTWWEEEALIQLPVILEGGTPPRYSLTYGGIDAFNALKAGQKSQLPLEEVLREHEATHRRLIAFIQDAPEEQIFRKTRFRRRLRLDTYSHYPEHTEAIRRWRERRSAG
jgi:hypothetical protein